MPETPQLLYTMMIILLKVLPIAQIIIMYLCGIIGGGLIGFAGYKILFAKPQILPADRISLGLPYTSIRVIPTIRRDSTINEIKERNRGRRPSELILDSIEKIKDRRASESLLENEV